MENYLISVIVPVYNVKEYLKDCISSLIAQTYSNIEIILIDDGSSDGSEVVCDEYEKFDTRIRVFHQKNQGLSSARNCGIKNARGKYIVFVDSDDWVHPQYIESMYEVLIKNECDIAQCGYTDVIEENLQGKYPEYNDSRASIFTGRELCFAMYTLLSWQCNLAVNKLYKRSLFENIYFPVGKIHEDEFTIYKVNWKAQKIAVIPDKLYYYRHRSGSITQQSYNKNRLDAGEAFSERASFFEEREEHELAYLTREYHLDWINRQKDLLQDVEDRTREDITKYLLQEEARLKMELEHGRSDKAIPRLSGGVFPFAQVSKGASVILYGGGNIGRQYYRQVYLQDYCNVVLWVDKNVEGCRNQGIPVEPIDRIRTCEKQWDYIVIAIDNMVIVHDVIQLLVNDYGVLRNKILY